MRVALFSGNYNYLQEGANRALNQLVAYLEDRAGCEVRVYSPVTDTPAFEPAGRLVPVPSVALPVRSEFRLGLGLTRSTRADIAQFRPEIVHVSTPDILGTRAQTYAKSLGVPIVASLHTLFETYLAYYRLEWLRPMVGAHLRRFYRRSDYVLVPTEGLVAEMKTIRGDDQVGLWSRGVDRDLFNPERRDPAWRRKCGFADDDIVVLFFGRLVLEKGIDVFVAVVRELQRHLPVKALVVGSGPASGLFDGLPGTHLAGHLSGIDLARAVASADVMLAPSVTEAFGNVVLESMASGVPVVSADAPSARPFLGSGQAGYLVPPRDPSAYVEAVTALARSEKMRRAMGQAAREATRAYSWDAASESVASVYRSLISASANGEPNR